MLVDAATGGHKYCTTPEDMDRSFLAFAMAARKDR
jgi:hypothetical protein